MGCKCLLLVLVCWTAVAFAYNEEDLGYCDDLSCAPREVLLDQIRQLQDKIHSEPLRLSALSSSQRFNFKTPENPQMCGICVQEPCKNDGRCLADRLSPVDTYTCVCPDDTLGSNCETKLTCEHAGCGKNAICKIHDRRVYCTCPAGYTPDDKGDCESTVETCMNGDPHYTTFDGLTYDYQGTCPYIFSTPCTHLVGGKDNFIVKAKNRLPSKSNKVSHVAEAEIVMFNNTIHIDGKKKLVTFNGKQVPMPFNWQNQIKITYNGNLFFVRNIIDSVTVKFIYDYLCIRVPNSPEYQGACTLCGLAGNLDGNYKNDIATSRNCTFYNAPSDEMRDGNEEMQIALDSWITEEFNSTQDNSGKCTRGEHMRFECDNREQAIELCLPINQTINGTGPLAGCQDLGKKYNHKAFENCIYDVCAGTQICPVLETYVKQCMSRLMSPNVTGWRTKIGCQEIHCPIYSQYKACATTCPATCAEPNPKISCSSGCIEGCECDVGYYQDMTNLSNFTCIPKSKCPCHDERGNMHAQGTTWLSDECTVVNTCVDGVHHSDDKLKFCHLYGHCQETDMVQKCVCKSGYTGDGYNCTDIDECAADKSLCGEDHGTGECINTEGSYYCICNDYYQGETCQFYLPRRHCADLKRYWGYTENGFYTINPPYRLGSKDEFDNSTVYCNMKLDDGGFTLMSANYDGIMTGKSYKDYIKGFGDQSERNQWLGLWLINEMTTQIDTSLRIDLFRCAANDLPASNTHCYYQIFKVGRWETAFQLEISQRCTGTEQNRQDGWVRWNETTVSPIFLVAGEASDEFDPPILKNIRNGSRDCSEHFQNTGWWYDTTATSNGMTRCGVANLNGMHTTCENMPKDSSEDTYLRYAGGLVNHATLHLRPTDYPNYDNTVPTPCRDARGEIIKCDVY